MPRNLSPQFIKAMDAPAKGNIIEWDTAERGLGIRVTAAGVRSFVLRYVIDGREKRMTLGGFPALTLSAARELALKHKGDVARGRDPLEERGARRVAMTLGELVALYVAQHVERKQKPRTKLETKRALETHWKPLHGLVAGAVSRPQVAERLAVLADTNGPVAANRARAQLSALFGWAVGEGLAESNPVDGTRKPGAEAPRERTLTNAELAAVWQACRDDDHGRIVRLLMLTGQRREEVGGIAWQELALDRALWSLPSSRTKNGLPHDVPLSDRALAVIEGILAERDALDDNDPRRTRDLLFGRGEGSFSGWSKCKARLDSRIATARAEARLGRPLAKGEDPEPRDALPAWTLHDLRRTFVTQLAELGVVPHVIEACVNHISGHKAGVAGVYNRATYAGEKRQAMQLWGEHVAGIVGLAEPKVAALDAARRRERT